MTLATIAEADAEYARNVGYQRQHQAWILSDRDVWYRNPFYTGPAVRHPEDDAGCYDDDDIAALEVKGEEVEDDSLCAFVAADIDNDIPF